MLQGVYVLAFGIIAVLAPAVWAQSSTGEIDVYVADSSEAVVGDARVTITGAETGAVVRQLNTNASGLAPVPLLNPGIYDVKVEKEGFRPVLRSGGVLRVTDVRSLRVRLEVGAATQSITIDDEAA